MNPPSNPPGQQGDPSWVTDTWDHTSNSATGQYQGGARPEWDWENQMLLVQTPAAGAGASADVDTDRKPQVLSVPTATLCNRPYGANYPTAAIPQSFPHHNAMGSFNPASMRSYGLEGYHGHPSTHSLHTGLVPSLGQAATPSELNAELRSYDQRRRFLGMHMLGAAEHKNVLDFVKREDMYSLGEAHTRIGLNLGGRTYFSAEDSARLGKRSRMNSLTHAPMCQVQGCSADLSKAKHYHRRHKVCEIHSKAPNVIANGQTQRFCQQCSRFHQLSEFDDTKRSCRKRLADHNRRRRKPQHSAVVTISESFKTEEQSTNMRSFEGDHKSILINMQKSGSPTASITDRGSISSVGNRLQNQPPTFGTVDDKLVNRNSLLRGQAIPSSDVQALVLSVVSRNPSSAQGTRQSPGTQESIYQQYLHGPSLSLSSAGMGAQTQHNSPSGQSYSSIEPSVPWLGSASGSRSTLVQARPLQGFPPSRENQLLQVGGNCNPQFLLQPAKSSDWVTREQLGRLGLQNVQGSMDGHQMLALIENPGQQLDASVHDVKPLQHSEMQSSGVRSSFGSSFYDSSSSIG